MEQFTIDELIRVSAGLSPKEMERLCDLGGIGLMNLDLRTGDIQLNRNLTMLTGYEPGELPHSDNTKLMLTYEDDRARVARALDAVVSGRQPHYQLEYRMRRKDSSIVSLYECIFVAERDAQGKPVRLAGLGIDLSKLKWAEEKARLMEEENRRLARSASQSSLEEQNRMLRAANSAANMIVGGIHQDYEQVLRQSLQILGESIGADRVSLWRNIEADGKLCCFHRSEWHKKASSAFFGGNRLFQYDEFLPDWEELAGQRDVSRQMAGRLTAGFWQYVDDPDVISMVLIPLFLHGEFWGFIGFDDCSAERIFTEDEIEIMGSAALVIASSVSRNVTYAKLNEARRKAMESTRAKGEFLSRMSHEIRTPMNAIIGMTTLAKRTDDPSRIRYCLDKVDSSSRQLLGLINDILDMSKIEADKLEINTEPFDFEKMIQYVINMMQVKLEEKHQELHLDIQEAFTRMMISDELKLSQVLINLLGNAIKFTPVNGSITLKIREKIRIAERSVMRLEVIDTGIGIEDGKKERLFESFEQADGGITRKFGGTGLGLSISKKIISLMGGDIWVESEFGKGSSFIFEIAVAWGGALPHVEPVTAIPSSLRVLVIDDNEDVLDYFKNILGSFNVVCDVAGGGAAALALVKKRIGQKQPYDMVFVDWNMPGMSGCATAMEIRRLAGDGLISVMISVAEWSDIEKEARACGVTNFLSKPVLPSVLYDTILELTKKNIMFPKTQATSDNINWSGRRILVAEDVDINREIVAGVLEETGVELVFAVDGREAVDFFAGAQPPFDLILMDVQMPGMDGLQATETIRRLETGKAAAVPIIAMTANAFKEDEKICLEAGMDAHIAKPLNVDDMYAVLQKYMK